MIPGEGVKERSMAAWIAAISLLCCSIFAATKWQELEIQYLEIQATLWVFPKIGIPKNGWWKMDDLGVPLFLETPLSTTWVFLRSRHPLPSQTEVCWLAIESSPSKSYLPHVLHHFLRSNLETWSLWACDFRDDIANPKTTNNLLFLQF